KTIQPTFMKLKAVVLRAAIATLVVANVFFGVPLDALISVVNRQLAGSDIAYTLPTSVPLAHAATSTVSMRERYYGARSNTSTGIVNYSFTWQAPTGITALTVEARGGGGGGGGSSATNARGGGGGGGGGYARSTNVPVTAGTNYALAIGRGGAGG